MALEDAAAKTADGLFIFNQQNGFGSAVIAGRPGDGIRCIGGEGYARKDDSECCADRDLAGDFNPSLVLFDNSVNGRKP